MYQSYHKILTITITITVVYRYLYDLSTTGSKNINPSTLWIIFKILKKKKLLLFIYLFVC